MSDDYTEGYKQGFMDGYKLAKDTYTLPTQPFTSKPSCCSVCGMSFVDEMGRPKIMGYVCRHPRCPSQISCYVGNVEYVGDRTVGDLSKRVYENSPVATGQFSIADPGPVDGLSYEEIYGSVIYQQNNKKEE